ncbi:hypothetical protein BASA81_016227 [Batrachochytrium salamandrivorans]|nr:hypothetical protein BASA81_016227 [Batrachochytrium salamandrivorans]
MTVPLVLETSTKRNIVLGSVGSGNTLTLVKLVASACVSLTAAISAELELSGQDAKFFTKLSASEKDSTISH